MTTLFIYHHFEPRRNSSFFNSTIAICLLYIYIYLLPGASFKCQKEQLFNWPPKRSTIVAQGSIHLGVWIWEKCFLQIHFYIILKFRTVIRIQNFLMDCSSRTSISSKCSLTFDSTLVNSGLLMQFCDHWFWLRIGGNLWLWYWSHRWPVKIKFFFFRVRPLHDSPLRGFTNKHANFQSP